MNNLLTVLLTVAGDQTVSGLLSARAFFPPDPVRSAQT